MPILIPRTSLILLAVMFTLTAVDPAYAVTGCDGQDGYSYVNDKKRNPRPGGFVSYSASVDEYSEIAPTAEVCDSAIVEYSSIIGNARVGGDAVVKSSKIMGNARVGGDAYIEKATLRGFYEISTGELKGVVYTAEKPMMRQSTGSTKVSKEATIAYINKNIKQAVGKPAHDDFTVGIISNVASEMGGFVEQVILDDVCGFNFDIALGTYSFCYIHKGFMTTSKGDRASFYAEVKYSGIKLLDVKDFEVGDYSDKGSAVGNLKLTFSSKSVARSVNIRVPKYTMDQDMGRAMVSIVRIPYSSSDADINRRLTNAFQHLKGMDSKSDDADPFR